LNSSSDEELPGLAYRILMDLVELAKPGNYSIFPLDLKIINYLNTLILE